MSERGLCSNLDKRTQAGAIGTGEKAGNPNAKQFNQTGERPEKIVGGDEAGGRASSGGDRTWYGGRNRTSSLGKGS